ncbi:MAG: 50S ribosomal protein L23 [Candidatus Buchananbacteria bacterium RIFCSPHIGHO2_02_FULL_40_13]|uniref:Large ribosomal subunit protein uL23 n=1 Tax=Candidatus Buchananbacteria bacterium RIFCSPLOWO2_01_FULL_39_33 TaxID=1797543 RepID=A0A1G1YLD5_9BACT|nr:MAG: 50S ribosomal protein L23 [Candidatus Buchananbacteria bacterium RIFCSPHIGHO2_01_FULL_40_35]OGY50601.1 MAG: 50S ribosomal protein L23 [Candidatus Buchananbacteria bacterium RIFCSPHIGHO2_02_FULL_40_13]OGY53074.1 MAG: 50S ribosomal protein L23 [Candidatus Buchananbacteria bacterium RIFCSPLOWO2_01_FULL_39_33]
MITEKATNLGQKNQYVFAISNKANKIQIAQAIEARYGVKPIKVNVLNISGKVVRRGRQIGRTKDWRKAVITLPAGKNIQIHEGV